MLEVLDHQIVGVALVVFSNYVRNLLHLSCVLTLLVVCVSYSSVSFFLQCCLAATKA